MEIFNCAMMIMIIHFASGLTSNNYETDETEEHSHICEDPLKEFISCQSSGCIKTCANPNPIQCTLDCAHGCFCRQGYVMDEKKSKCVKIQDCTVLCRDNEEYRECLRCEATCRQKQPACPSLCATKGQGSCFCRNGFVRNSIGQCIKPKEC